MSAEEVKNTAVQDIGAEEDGVRENALDTTKKYLTFISDGINYAINSDYVVEIINEHRITHLPQVPDFIKGVINLRGQIVPIMDIRLRMGRPETEITRETCTIIVNVGETSVGLLVDKVSQMPDFDERNIAPPPVGEQFVSGISRLGNEIYMMLDCENLIHNE